MPTKTRPTLSLALDLKRSGWPKSFRTTFSTHRQAKDEARSLSLNVDRNRRGIQSVHAWEEEEVRRERELTFVGTHAKVIPKHQRALLFSSFNVGEVRVPQITSLRRFHQHSKEDDGHVECDQANSGT